MFRRVLVANRGEIALRVIRACRELGIKSVAVYSEADRWANYVAQADESYLLGPAPPAESYLRVDRILELAKKARVDAIHPGYGFLAENPAFADACAQEHVAFIGPKGRAIRAVGNKIEARTLAERHGIPVVPGISREVTAAEALAFARAHGFPVLLKAAAGGGGRGQRVVRSEKDLGRAMREAVSEAAAAFGDGTVFVEKYVERPRHVEIQILADAHGHVVHLGERECSIQRRHQKVVEESPSVSVDDRLRERMGEAAKAIARLVAYENAGTCEFLVDEKRDFYFLEVNTRLQVEHPVTELITGIDIVKQQFLIAAGEPLAFTQDEVRRRGHAIEARVCAEDPFSNFAPSMGEISGVRLPAGPFVRVDSDLVPPARVTAYYDSLLAKVVVWAEDRAGAIDRMVRALREFKIVGVQTTIPFHLQLLRHPRFRSGDFHTRFLEEEFDFRDVKAEHHLEAAVIAAALDSQRRRRCAPVAEDARPLSAWQTTYRQESP
ncbi:MAG: acetyl-CoA carboxylase biotin carboxylase subunit [Planctomycetes bacterium]|nr:acetyl-CoA carboxylase biotin carboxylase subunit [Planctomycetota bacterium]